MNKNFDYPTQVVFTFNNGEYYERCSGIAYHNEDNLWMLWWYL